MKKSVNGSLSERVYGLLCEVPRGRVVTYGELARAAGCGSARAVGQVLRRNPYAPQVPCHRVIRADLRLGGYAGATSGAKYLQKEALLAAEGVNFVSGVLSSHSLLWYFPESVAKNAYG